LSVVTDWTGRCVRTDKSGFIAADTPKILEQLGLDEERWIETVHLHVICEVIFQSEKVTGLLCHAKLTLSPLSCEE